MSTRRNYETIERAEGLTVTSLHQQIQSTQEAYFDIERDLESSLNLIQEAVELFEDGDDISSIMDRMRQLLEEKQK